MLPFDEVALKSIITNVFDMSKNIYNLCTSNLDDPNLSHKILRIYTDRSNLIDKLVAWNTQSKNKSDLQVYFDKYSKDIQEIVDLDGKIIEILAKMKIEMAQELKKIQINKNVLIYK